MPRVHLLSFFGSKDANDGYAERQRHLHRTAAEFGAIEVQHPWDMARLKQTSFYEDNKAILDRPRGAGFWLWKPWLIQQLLDDIPAGDFLVYHDVGRVLSRTPGIGYQFRRPVTPLVEWAENHDGMFPGIYLPVYGRSARWTKRDCFVLMDCDEARYHNAPQVWAGMNVWQNTARVRGFIERWLDYCKDPRILTDQPNTCGLDNSADFKDHRHDQSILGNLILKEKLSVFNRPDNEVFKHRDVDYITRRVAVEKQLAANSTAGIESLFRIATSDHSSHAHDNAVNCYQLHLEECRGDALKLLEVSYTAGNLSGFWRRYLPHTDITFAAPGAAETSGESRPANGSSMISLDPGHRPALELFARRQAAGKFDVIVVSGALTMQGQQLAIGALFPLLSPGGHLFVEALEASRKTGAPGQAADLDAEGRNSTLNLIRRINIPEFRFTSRYFTLNEVHYLEKHADTAGVHWSKDASHGVAVIRHKR